MQWLLSTAQKADAVGSSSFCNPAALHNAVVLRLVILDEAIATTNQAIVDSAYGTLYDTTRRALACMPADPFAWLTLFRLDVTKRGLQAENANYLRLSYALGPNESWIALWRNKLAFSLFERLPTDLSDDDSMSSSSFWIRVSYIPRPRRFFLPLRRLFKAALSRVSKRQRPFIVTCLRVRSTIWI